MHALVAEEIESYLDQAGPDVLGSVGGYHIESSGRRLFASVEGETDTIMGLPMAAVLDFMQRRRSRERATPAC
jgi:septum formation protein